MGASPHWDGGQQRYRLGGGFMRKTYSLHPEAAAAIHHLEEIFVWLAAEEVEAGDLEVTPEMAHVVLLAFHGFRVDVWQFSIAWLGLENVFGERLLVLVLGVTLGQVFRLVLLLDRKSTRLNSSHSGESRMPSSA